jgi:Kdo2-lipid IVA lauroyltransferase/acyltransferase
MINGKPAVHVGRGRYRACWISISVIGGQEAKWKRLFMTTSAGNLGRMPPCCPRTSALWMPLTPISATRLVDEQTRSAAVAEVIAGAQLSRKLPGRLEIVFFWLVVAPLLARLPARLGYRIACRRADWTFRHWPGGSALAMRNLGQIFGETRSSAEIERMAREHLRGGCCEIVDIMKLRRRTPPLTKLVEFRGREHLDAAIAEGKGAILCTAHFGSYESAFSLIHASGIPVTDIGRWWWNYDPNASAAVRRFWDFAYGRRILRYRQRPNIEPWAGRIMSAMQAASALRRNEVVTICCDAVPLESDQARTVKVPFLGREAAFVPGVATLAQLTRAPVLMVFVYRSEDYCHQIVEISAPVSMEGEPATAFQRCAAAVEAAITTNPALWGFWAEANSLTELGLIPTASSPGNVAVA